MLFFELTKHFVEKNAFSTLFPRFFCVNKKKAVTLHRFIRALEWLRRIAETIRQMKRILSILFVFACVASLYAQQKESARQSEIATQREFFDPTRKKEKVQEEYHFTYDWRVEVGYVQNQQRSENNTYMNPNLFGAKVGATIDFNLPYHLSIQTGLFYTLTYGQLDQHFRSLGADDAVQVEYLRHREMQHQLGVPVRLFYTQNLWRSLNLFFYGGPKFEFGLAAIDNIHQHVSPEVGAWLQQQGLHINPYNRYTEKELWPVNIQLGVGGGIEWDVYRLQAGYDFGLNNLVRTKPMAATRMWEWGYYVSFCYRIRY